MKKKSLTGAIILMSCYPYPECTLDCLYKAISEQDLVFLKVLAQKGMDFNIGNGELLLYAIKKNLLNVATFLLEHGVNPNSNEFSSSPLRHAIQQSNVELIKLLISMGATICGNALIYACSYGNKEIIELLLSLGANIHARGEMSLDANIHAQGEMPLMTVVVDSNLELVKLLLAHGAKTTLNILFIAKNKANNDKSNDAQEILSLLLAH